MDGDIHDAAAPSLWTGSDFSERVSRLPGCQFMLEVISEFRHLHARERSGHFFAIKHLLPELLEGSSPLRVMCGGGCSHLANAGGRWVTYYGKALGHKPGIQTTICAQHKISRTVPPKQLLFQQPQKVLQKPWASALKDAKQAPDVIAIYSSTDPSTFEGLVDSLEAVPCGTRTLICAYSFSHQVLLRRLLTERGYTVGCFKFFAPDE